MHSTYNKSHQKYYQKNKEVLKKSSNNPHKNIRNELFEILGRSCVRCGFSDMRALQLDHVYGGGLREIKDFKSNYQMYKFYLQNSSLCKIRLQVLCANCNWIKRYDNNEVKKC